MTTTAQVQPRRAFLPPRELWGRKLGRALFYAIAGLASIFFMLPFVWALFSSLKTIPELYRYPPIWLPEHPQWRNYAQIFRDSYMDLWLINSVYVSGMSVLAVVISSAITGYGFARFRFPGRELIFMLVLSPTMLPTWVTVIPTFIMFSSLKWLNTFKPLIVPPWFGGGAFNIFLMRQFFRTIPMDLDEAALIDGASPWRILWSVLFPLAGPSMATVGILTFIGSWNNFLGPLIYLTSEKKYTVAVGIRYFETFQGAAMSRPREHLLMGASMIIATPPLILFFLAQKYFVQGIVMSGIKG
ncbi:MAG: carbohydrate ABC transporter permease [Anaerolineae bacterium]|nr:carbohydrate ABC transporter permease [Anaerolineae bacterium]